MPSSTEATLPALLASLAQELSRELRGRGCRVRLTAAKAEQLALDLALVHFGVRVACLIDAFLPTAASIEALSAVLERFFANAPTAEGRSWILVQHVPSEQLYLVHPALVGELSADLATARGGALDEASPVIWLDARSTVRAGTRLTRAPSHLARSLGELLQHLDKGDELIYLEGPEGQQEEKTQRRRTLEGVSLAGLLLEYGGVYSLLGGSEQDADGAQADRDGRNNLSGEPLMLFTLSLVPAGNREGLGERNVLSFSIPVCALHHGEKEQLMEWTKERTRSRIERLVQSDGEKSGTKEASKGFVQWLNDCAVEVKAREVVLDLVGL